MIDWKRQFHYAATLNTETFPAVNTANYQLKNPKIGEFKETHLSYQPCFSPPHGNK